ncbi:MAG TPA: Ig-like domain-containing protein, partial [Candidatus Ozemobacteraceae bacterium]
MNRGIRAVVLGALLVGAGPALPVSAAVGMTTAGQAIQVVRTIPADMAADVQSSTPLTVEFGGPLTQAFYQTINLNLFRNGQSIDGELFYNPAARQVMFKPKTPLQSGQMYTAQLSFGDGSGGTAEKMWNFRVVGAGSGRSASAAGGMTDAMQAAGAAGIAVPNVAAAASAKLAITNANMAGGTLNPQNPLEVSFSEALDITSLKDAPVKLLCNRETVGVDYRLSRDLKTLTLVPRQPLRPGNEYGVAISQTLSGSSGARLPKNTVIPFRVGGSSAADIEVPANVLEEAPADAAAPVPAPARRQGLINTGSFDAPVPDAFAAAPVQNVAPLKLVGMSPQNGSVVTNLSQPVTIAFNQDVRPETLNEFTFRVEDEFGPVPARIQYLSGQKRAILTPVGVLDANRSYRIIITQGITDLSGRPLQAGNAATFATRSPAAAP